MKKILITGASGFLGYYLLQELLDTQRFELVAGYCRQALDLEHPNLGWAFANFLELDTLPTFFEQIGRLDAIIHCAGIANLNFCEKYPALSHRLNVHASTALAQQAKKMGIPFIFISTDLVFNGSSPIYTETDFPYPLSQYGKQKNEAEEALLTDFDNTIVCRLPLLFGWGAGVGNTNFFRNIYENLQASLPILAFTDEHRTPLSGKTAAQGLRQLLDWALSAYKKYPDTWELGRLIQFAGKESISRYDLALQIAQYLELSTDLVQKSLRADTENGHLRPADVSLSGDLAKQLLGFEPNSLAEQLAEMPKK